MKIKRLIGISGAALLGLILGCDTPSQATSEPVAPDGFVFIQGGTFLMGSSESEPERDDDETPQHSVTVSSFFMRKYEVTLSEYVAVMGTSQLPSILPPESLYDVISWFNVSWYDAIEYCNKRSEQEGLTPAYTIDKSQSDPNNQSNNDKLKWLVTWNQETNGYRLPTEAEWEYACRAGTTGPFNTGENITTDQANYDGNYPYNNNPTGMNRGGPTYLGSFEPNSWGLYDMHGNMWEWCWDWDGDYPRLYFENSMTNPVGPSSGKSRIRRGGSWADPARYLRSANRGGAYPSDRNFTLGCRLVRSCL